MEDPTSPAQFDDSLAETIAKSLASQREQVDVFLAAQQDQLERAETELADETQRLVQELAQNQDDADSAGDLQEEMARREEQIETLSRLVNEIDGKQEAWDKTQTLFSEQQGSFADQVKDQQKHFEQCLTELEKRQLGVSSDEADRAHRQLEEKQVEFESKVGSLRRENNRLQEELANSEPASDVDSEELQNLRTERDLLAKHLAEMEQRTVETSADDQDDNRRRYEMSVEEIRDLKKQVKELEDQLDTARTAASSDEQDGMLSWEAQKKRLMASLENDFDDKDEQDVKERAAIEKLVEQTNQMMDAKVSEISELKQLLKDQSSNLGQVAVGAAALGEVLDNDAIIQEERENLKRTQEEWKEKLRKAEVEISIERANIARETARLTEKERSLEACSNANAGSKDHPSDDASRAGRWLERLSLQNLNEEHKG